MSQSAWMVYGPQGTWSEHLDDGPWTVEDILEPFGGWQGTYLNWREDCWPADVEHYLIDASKRYRMPLLGCYVQVSDFGYVVALLPGEVVTRYVVNPEGTEGWIEGGWALEQCAAHHGVDWQRTGLAALARWSQVAPRPLAVDQLEPLLAAEHLFPSIPCSATCRLRSASSRRPSLRPGRTCRSADRLQLRNAEFAGRGRVWRQRRALRAGGCRWCCTAPCFSSQWSCCWVACARSALADGWGFLDGGSAVAAHSGWR